MYHLKCLDTLYFPLPVNNFHRTPSQQHKINQSSRTVRSNNIWRRVERCRIYFLIPPICIRLLRADERLRQHYLFIEMLLSVRKKENIFFKLSPWQKVILGLLCTYSKDHRCVFHINLDISTQSCLYCLDISRTLSVFNNVLHKV